MSVCRSCGMPVVWVATVATLATEDKKGKPSRKMPLDADPENPSKALAFEDGNITFTRERDASGTWLVRYVPKRPGLYRSHFTSCPQAATHRKGKR